MREQPALRFLGSLLSGEIHALQALAALVNQVRKLLVAKDFMEGPGGAAWQRGCTYPRFQQSVMPALVRHDQELLARLEAGEAALAEEEPAAPKKKRKKAKVATDLLLAKNPANAYPVYQLLKKAERFSRADLLRALAAVREAVLAGADTSDFKSLSLIVCGSACDKAVTRQRTGNWCPATPSRCR